MLRYLKEIYRFLKHIKNSRALLFTLAYEDFRQQYLGSYLGIVWAILRPLLFICVIWLVFTMGFRARLVDDDTPFVLWLLCGMIPWFFFAEGLNKGMTAIVGNAYLVKKVAFRVGILPIVKILSALSVHLILLALLVIAFMLNGYTPNLYWLQLVYYLLCSLVLLLGLSWLTSAIRVFVRDTAEIIGVITQFGFWLTPIFWSFDLIPEKYHWLIKFNPMVYIVQGYRDTFIYQRWFWDKPQDTLQFLCLVTLLLVLGVLVFKRLRPHFGDVL